MGGARGSSQWPTLSAPPLEELIVRNRVGLLLFVRTVALLATVGRGTLAPWNPTTRLVVRGPYRHVRNPMICGVAFVLLGEATLLGSRPLLVWFAAFVAVNAARA